MFPPPSPVVRVLRSLPLPVAIILLIFTTADCRRGSRLDIDAPRSPTPLTLAQRDSLMVSNEREQRPLVLAPIPTPTTPTRFSPSRRSIFPQRNLVLVPRIVTVNVWKIWRLVGGEGGRKWDKVELSSACSPPCSPADSAHASGVDEGGGVGGVSVGATGIHWASMCSSWNTILAVSTTFFFFL